LQRLHPRGFAGGRRKKALTLRKGAGGEKNTTALGERKKKSHADFGGLKKKAEKVRPQNEGKERSKTGRGRIGFERHALD